MSELRPYQFEAVEAAKAWLKSSIEPALIEAATGAGKAHLAAHMCDWLNKVSGGKRVLCLCPQKELVKQNWQKFIDAGGRASIFSASAGAKSTRHEVVFGTPITVAKSISRFKQGYAGIIVDEAHGLSPTVLSIIEEMREGNPNLRVLGMTATPFRMGSGYIYKIGVDGRVNGEDTCRDPFFTKLVYKVGAKELIDQGFLTRPVIGGVGETYDTSNLVLKPNGKFDDASVDAAFVGHGRKTAAITGSVVDRSRDRNGVVFFAATIQHAKEIMASLPPHLSAMVTGEKGNNRDKALKDFEARRIKYLVNVSVLTTGWDCAHVDVIAILRRSESVGLLQQVVGRGLRLSPLKKDCLILDFADNITTHMPDGDLFAPIVRAKKSTVAGNGMTATCPSCSYENNFTANPDMADYQIDAAGNCLDVFGEPIVTDFGPMPAHYGRRCFGMIRVGRAGEYDRCNFRWAGKPCPQCNEPNDISARFCYVCKSEIVDVNEKLRMDFVHYKKNPFERQVDEVISATFRKGVSQKGNETMRGDFKTKWRQFSCWWQTEPKNARAMRDWELFCTGTDEGREVPRTVTYFKEPSGFYRVVAFNEDCDIDPSLTLELEAAE